MAICRTQIYCNFVTLLFITTGLMPLSGGLLVPEGIHQPRSPVLGYWPEKPVLLWKPTISKVQKFIKLRRISLMQSSVLSLFWHYFFGPLGYLFSVRNSTSFGFVFPIVLILCALMRHKLSKWPYAELRVTAISVLCYFISCSYIYIASPNEVHQDHKTLVDESADTTRHPVIKCCPETKK